MPLLAAWVPFFDDMDAIIFLAAISCFDQTLAEDATVNRLVRFDPKPLNFALIMLCLWLRRRTRYICGSQLSPTLCFKTQK